MANFSNIVDDIDWQYVSFINELINAYSERRQALGYSSVANKAVDTDIHATSFWTTMQNWLETYCVYFVDHTIPIAGSNGPTLYTLASWRAAAGLNSSGFRRATAWTPGNPANWVTDVSFSYGQMQNDDIIGPWIFAELQAGLKALKWTTMSSTAYVPDSVEQKVVTTQATESPPDGNALLAQHINVDWPAGSWETVPGTPTRLYMVYAKQDPDGYYGETAFFNSMRIRGKPRLTNVPTFRPCACALYFEATVDYMYSFKDIDSLGLEYGKLGLGEELAAAQTATRDGSQFGDYPGCPVDLAGIVPWTQPWWVPPYNGGDWTAYSAQGSYSVTWILKWVFSYA